MAVQFVKKDVNIEALVSSESVEGAFYRVHAQGDDEWTCTCPDYVHRRTECKHLREVAKELSTVIPF